MHGNKKRNMLQSPMNVSACPHIKFLCFATFFLKFFVAETKKNSNQARLKNMLVFRHPFQQQKSYVASEKT